MAASPIKRRIKLINPKLQLKVVVLFIGLALGSLLVQLFILGMDLRLLAEGLPDSSVLTEAIPSLLLRSLLFTAGMWLPMTFAMGVVATHRIAGPVYHMEKHLEAILRGENPGTCRIRSNDEFHNLCRLINEAQAYTSAQPQRESSDEQEMERAA